jgi:hypothetical protein
MTLWPVAKVEAKAVCLERVAAYSDLRTPVYLRPQPSPAI